MNDAPHDANRRPATINKAKEARRYDQATEVAMQKILSLARGGVAELDAHPLTDVYVQELVRSEAVRMMKEGRFYYPEQLEQEIATRLSEELGARAANDIRPLVRGWVNAFRRQLVRATDVTERKRQIDRETAVDLRSSVDATSRWAPEKQPGKSRYNLEARERGAGVIALEGTPLYGQFNGRCVAETFGPELGAGFPVEVSSEGHIFLLDYDGAILTYGPGEETDRLFEAAAALVHRLESCFISE